MYSPKVTLLFFWHVLSNSGMGNSSREMCVLHANIFRSWANPWVLVVHEEGSVLVPSGSPCSPGGSVMRFTWASLTQLLRRLSHYPVVKTAGIAKVLWTLLCFRSTWGAPAGQAQPRAADLRPWARSLHTEQGCCPCFRQGTARDLDARGAFLWRWKWSIICLSNKVPRVSQELSSCGCHWETYFNVLKCINVSLNSHYVSLVKWLNFSSPQFYRPPKSIRFLLAISLLALSSPNASYSGCFYPG